MPTLIEKIWDAHRVGIRSDGKDLLYMDRHVMHDLHGPHALRRLAETRRSVRRPDLTFGALDHAVSTAPGRTAETNPEGTELAHAMRDGAKRFGWRLFDVGDAEQGIAHVVAPELGMVLPGATHACPDSHACTVGGVGALAFACGTSELEHVLATQTIAMKRPKQMRIRLSGRLQRGVSAKDVALHVVSRLGIGGGRGYVVEYTGDIARDLSIEGRMTLCNMTIEFGARTGLVAPDEKTLAWLRGRPWAPKEAAWDAALAHWRGLCSDNDATFDRDVTIDCSALEPQITWGTDPSQTIAVTGRVPQASTEATQRALQYMGLESGQALQGLPIHRVFIGSCTNARVEDLQTIVPIVQGRKVASNVQALIVPGSSNVKREAEKLGLDKIFTVAGFEWNESGCSMCAGANGDAAQRGQRVLATSNRNFENRQGPGVRTHLVSPATAAAGAIAGKIVDLRALMNGER